MKSVLILCAAALLSGGVPAKVPSYDDYGAVLKRFVDERGLVDYAGLKRERASLDAFARSLDALDPAWYESWGEKDRIAFWINAYNALTLKLIADHHPIGPARAEPAFPANSIRQIPGAWDGARFRVMGRERTLGEIENAVLRSTFKEPRIHMALVCAAVSCPKLRGEPYRGATLDAQLDDQARAFLSDSRKFRIDRGGRTVWASPIFQWFAPDFLGDAAEAEGDGARRALALFAGKYLSDADRRYLEGGDYEVRFLDYDWTLNERKP